MKPTFNTFRRHQAFTVTISFTITVTILAMLSFLVIASPAAAQSDSASKATAREHFDKGVAAFADKRFGEAADEFETAYRIEPAFVVLYNIGQVSVALGRSVEAVDAFDKYLKQGASAISPDRRREVKAEIEKQRSRIGSVLVKTAPGAAEIRVDGRLVGKTPLPGAIRLNAGRHTVEADLAGHATQFREVDVAGKSEFTVELTLDAVAAVPPPTPAPRPAPVVATPAPATPAPALASASASTSAPAAVAPAPSLSAHAGSASSINWQRVSGIVLGVGGVATATVGGLLAYSGATKANDALPRLQHPSSEQAWNLASSDYNAGKQRNQQGFIVAGIGAAVLVGGIFLIATAPETSSTVALGPWMTADGGGVVMNGVW